MLLNVVAPFAAYQVLTAHGASEVAALSVASVFPLVSIITAAVRSRQLEWIGVLSVASIALGLASVLVLRDPHAISPLLAAAVFGPLAGWTLYRRRHANQQDQNPTPTN